MSKNKRSDIDLTNIYKKANLNDTIARYASYINKNGTQSITNTSDIDITSILPITYRMDKKDQRHAFFQSIIQDNIDTLCNLISRSPSSTNATNATLTSETTSIPTVFGNEWIFKVATQHGGSGVHMISNVFTILKLFFEYDELVELLKQATSTIQISCTSEIYSKISPFTIEDDVWLMNFHTRYFDYTPISIDSSNIKHQTKRGYRAKRKHVIAQKMIKNVFLIKKRKFHIRSYWLVASGDPYLVLYGGTVLIISANEYNPEKLTRGNVN